MTSNRSRLTTNNSLFQGGERGGSVVECRTPEREVGGSKPTAAVLCPWARHFIPRKYWLITQEAVAPSRHDWKIVDWDVKPKHKQTIKDKRQTIRLSTMNYIHVTINSYLVTCYNILMLYMYNTQNKNYLHSAIPGCLAREDYFRWDFV